MIKTPEVAGTIMRTVMNIFVAMLVVGGLLSVAPAEAAAESITVQIRSIAATNDGNSFDPKLNDLKSKLQKAFGGYSNFEQVGNSTFKVAKDQRKSTSLPNGSSITVTFHGYAAKFIKLGLGIAGKLNTTLRASPGSTFFQAGLNYKGGILVLAITVRK